MALARLLTARGANVTALVGSAGAELAATGPTVPPYREHPLEGLPTFDVIIDTVGSELLQLRRHAPKGRTVTFTQSSVVRSGLQVLLSQVYGKGRVRFSRNVPGVLSERARR